MRQNLRRAGFAFFGIFNGTEFNPHFFEDIEKAVVKEKGAVLVCGVGGILEPLGRGGRQSRSAVFHTSTCIDQYYAIKLPVPYCQWVWDCCISFKPNSCVSLACAIPVLTMLQVSHEHWCVGETGYTVCRSLMAAYELASTGYQKVSILQGGFYEWERNGR